MTINGVPDRPGSSPQDLAELENIVERIIRKTGNERATYTININYINVGTLHGGLRAEGVATHQSIVVHTEEVIQNIDNFIDKLGKEIFSGIDDDGRRDVLGSLDILRGLAQSDKTETNIERAKKRLDIINGVFQVSKNIASIAAPFMPFILAYFGS